MKHLIEIATGALWGFDESQNDLYDARLASGDFRVATDEEVDAIQNPPLTADQVRANYEGAAQKMLDDFAKTWGYDSIRSCISYRGDPNPKYDAEAQAMFAWRSAVWTASEAIDAAVRNNERPAPVDKDAFIEELLEVTPKPERPEAP